MIDFEYWQSDVLKKIAYRGFNELNVIVRNSTVENLAAEAAGSPQLMQYLCLNSCYELGVKEKPSTQVDFHDDPALFDNICRRTALTADYASIVEKMKEGPKTRGSDRNIYITRCGWQGDVYRLLVKALSLDPPQLTFRYSSLIDRINSICVGSSPSGSSVTNSCYHAAAIVNDIHPNTVVEWDAQNDVFDIRDPYLLFYLRWADAVDG